MAKAKNRIHDFVSLYGAEAYVGMNYDLSKDKDYVAYIRYTNPEYGTLNPFDSDGEAIVVNIVSQAEVLHGVWNVICSTCNQRNVIRKNNALWICLACVGNTVGSFRKVTWRQDWKTVETVLLERPDAKNRNAFVNETVEQLLKENAENL